MRSNLALISDISGAPVQINGATTRLRDAANSLHMLPTQIMGKTDPLEPGCRHFKGNSNIDHNVGKETPALISALKRDAATG
jgi:hypothetical protein